MYMDNLLTLISSPIVRPGSFEDAGSDTDTAQITLRLSSSSITFQITVGPGTRRIFRPSPHYY